jgi:alkylresorcinol/alkylpyrone synthase
VVQRVRSEDERGAILGHRRMLTIDGSEEVLRWTLLPSGFRLTLGRDLPSTIRRALLSLSGDAASFATPRPRDSHRPIRWIAHAGGVAVLDAVRRTLDLPASALESASSTLERYGNLSSASVLYALHWELENPCSDNRSQPGVLLSFGPGMCVDAIGCTLRGGHY